MPIIFKLISIYIFVVVTFSSRSFLLVFFGNIINPLYLFLRQCRQVLKTHEPVYQAIWVDNADFDEVLISPAMIQDHMPDTVLAALNKVSKTVDTLLITQYAFYVRFSLLQLNYFFFFAFIDLLLFFVLVVVSFYTLTYTHSHKQTNKHT